VYWRLSSAEKATVRVTAPPLSELPLRNSLVGEAAARLCSYGDTGELQHVSGHRLARWLNYTFNAHPMALRYARKGWGLLALVDAADLGVQIHISGEPQPDRPSHFRPIRLRERVAEFDAE
jgi:hypothetical protein